MAQGLFGRLQQELAVREKVAGLTMADVLALPAAERQLVTWLMRTGVVSQATISATWGDTVQVQSLLTGLVAQGFVRAYERGGERYYDLRLAPRRQRALPESIWQALNDRLGKPAKE